MIFLTMKAKIYHIEPAIDETISSITGVPVGPSFHFVLNSTVAKDNRIPPRGYDPNSFANFGGLPVDYSYEPGQYWDDTSYEVPIGATSAQITLYYQSTSKEFIEFLRDENNDPNNNLGQVMYDLWDANGKCPPELMQQIQIDLTPNTVPADLDLDFDVDFDDLTQFFENWLAVDCVLPEDCGRADLIDDGTVNNLDFAEFASYWGWTLP